jgi:hypothetical protein
MSKHGGIGEYGSDIVTPAKMAFLPRAQQLAASILVEINNDAELRACTTFTELHVLCDANTLGDSESVLADPDYGIDCVLVAQAIVNAQLRA